MSLCALLGILFATSVMLDFLIYVEELPRGTSRASRRMHWIRGSFLGE